MEPVNLTVQELEGGAAISVASRSPFRQAVRRFWKHRAAMVCAIFVGLIILVTMFGPMLSPYTYKEQNLTEQFQPPSSRHWCGTDVLGRDLLTRLLEGGQISFLVGFAAALLSLFIGLVYGAIAGYFGGKIDLVMMRVVDILYGLPYLAYIILIIALLKDVVQKQGLTEAQLSWSIIGIIFVALGSISWLTISRIVRGQVLSLKEKEFVEAARALGVSDFRIIFTHLVPNLLGTVIVYTTLTMPSIMLAESFISFLGLGVQAPMASWGVLINDGVISLNPLKIYWWLLLFPAFFLGLTLLALNIIGDGLRDALDVN